ncbi:hypothetical protein GPECTOR_19g297 [Gonium pectorale]|uniref:Uncharacterized protein n=1 Tax=Gonium pectorale TaxID=33097 RepID=A0A150GJ79_GONPE|nr:hypothetical protein GPECTOR_19g297 [Gonium pectorale]|eukprot:KXZ49846.1 hypothetical protein GPECTOR_19g297 [Gonium pectorale]
MESQGGLYTGYYAVAAALRYEKQWISVVASPQKSVATYTVPPLDVAFAWFVHRQVPAA